MRLNNSLSTVAREEAEAHCYAIAPHYLPNRSGLNTRSIVGSYDLHLTRSGARWHIDRFRFDLEYSEGNLDLQG